MENISNILDKGFAYLPCERHLLNDLFGENRPFEGDPQNFGMICFADVPVHKSGKIRKEMGNYGIAVSSEWAKANQIVKVKYVSRLKAIFIKKKFLNAMEKMGQAIKYPDDEGLLPAYRNKDFAEFLGVREYSKMLEKYEYSQTARHSYQKE